ncbi:MAG: hypoxanthine phosphoribosyltransferase [Eubacteriales bacterium]|jgi:hypoxanthine phosphoribosyltransferase|nr:hypoxanthine phosphoribosyltransferase [Bacillota bacterium]MBV1726560.1 hypoxanthine phosphoribosyltransferase [Desulforudis sp.]MDP3050485.1 hypoxanthine phosphoribosyltransferase [Eubacteriales bacterium]MDQ7788714.1 hypoxanthine phosphoribosyltransferase [Clostridia bacterium]MBU4532078.1 hypoxanthine phosphoribosyltransferase [Bacillota bacterium]
MHQDLERKLVSGDEIQDRVAAMGREIARDFIGKDLLLVGILKGSTIFMADLARQIDIPVAMDYMAVSSYGLSTTSSGVVRILKDLEESIEGRHVLIVEDIVDTGLTLNYLLEYLRSRGPAEVKVCVLLDKYERRKVDVQVDYLGFTIPDEFAVGYGLDYRERYRNLGDIWVLKPEVYTKQGE